ncbi:prepilin peptidase [Paracraurococcus lichenis]|uniref:Prepilin peptidase n=1 Tax=Paracraurococcus lichenis TaxID=3064888 RepID=A0ABT9DYZ8_9PROT|nr:prepilin peptidase [Paracraurococcus sp. LOR1-02]MDO9709132.1 prepilin peptidase [Paracraurococcus sp. LOR1-02]
MALLALAPALALLLAAALHDIAARTIPNAASLAIALAGLAARALAEEALPGLAAALAVFLLAWLAWRCRVMGGGDVKLLAACALLVPPAAVPSLVLATAIAGGLLGLAYLALRPLLPAPAAARPGGLPGRALRAEAWRIRRGGPLPYAVAIALGTFFTLLV